MLYRNRNTSIHFEDDTGWEMVLRLQNHTYTLLVGTERKRKRKER